MKIATVGLSDNYEAIIDPLSPRELLEEVVKFLKEDFGKRHKNPLSRELVEKLLLQEWEDWQESLLTIEVNQFPVSCSIKMRPRSPTEEVFYVQFFLPNGTEIGKVLIQFFLKSCQEAR